MTRKDRISGLYGIADARASNGDPARFGAALLAGGCRLIQLRCKGWKDEDVLPVARELARRSRAVGATFIVNDSPEIAIAVDADGVHVGELDGDLAEIRCRLGDERILGRSTNDLKATVKMAQAADYVAFGPIWATKNDDRRGKTPRGVPALVSARNALPSETPLVAIGGISVDRVPDVIRAGANAWAVIAGIAESDDWVEATREFVRCERGER